MKRILLLLTFLLCLTGCGKQEPEPIPEAAALPDASLQTETVAEDKKEAIQGISVFWEERCWDYYDSPEEDIKLLDFDTVWPEVHNPRNQAAADRISDYLRNENSKFIKGMYPEGDPYGSVGMEQSLQYAKERQAEMGDDFTPFAADRSYEIHRGDSKVLSLCCLDYLNLGGPHGTIIRKSMNFDMETGELLSLEDLSEDPDSFRTFLLHQMVNMAENREEISGAIDWYEKEEYEQAFSSLLRQGSWYFENSDFVIQSLPYELGAYAAGPVSFRIPLAELTEYVKPSYYPEKREPGVMILSEETNAEVTEDITVGEAYQSVYLEASGSLYDLTLIPLTPNETGEYLLKKKPVFYCSELKDGAIRISLTIPDTFPTLMVRFSDADGLIQQGLLTQSGEDGRYFLMDGASFFPYD